MLNRRSICTKHFLFGVALSDEAFGQTERDVCRRHSPGNPWGQQPGSDCDSYTLPWGHPHDIPRDVSPWDILLALRGGELWCCIITQRKMWSRIPSKRYKGNYIVENRKCTQPLDTYKLTQQRSGIFLYTMGGTETEIGPQRRPFSSCHSLCVV